MQPLVSVIIPVKDRSESLLKALVSLENQVFRDFEILVVDDHSQVSPSKILESYNPKVFRQRKNLGEHIPPIPIRWLLAKGEGVSAARNTGIEASSSEFIGLLDSDDEWAPEKLLKQIQYLEDHPHIPLVHTDEIWIRNGVRVNPMKKHQKSGGRIFERCTELCVISPSASVFRRKLLDHVGMFDESFVVCEDYDLWLRIASKFEIGYIDEALTLKYGGHEDQLSRKYHSMDLWRLRALSKHLKGDGLSELELKKVKEQIRLKGEVLMKGFIKHQNYTHVDEVQGFLKQAFL